MKQSLAPTTIAAPFGAYSQGIASTVSRVVVTSGQLGLAADGTVPAGVTDQTRICLENIDAILAEAGMTRGDILRLNAYVTDRAHMADYMAARDAWLEGVTLLPASTLMIVTGFSRPEFLVEIEAIAATGANG